MTPKTCHIVCARYYKCLWYITVLWLICQHKLITSLELLLVKNQHNRYVTTVKLVLLRKGKKCVAVITYNSANFVAFLINN